MLSYYIKTLLIFSSGMMCYSISVAQVTSTSTVRDSLQIIDYYKNGNKRLEGYYYVRINSDGDSVFSATGKQLSYYKSGELQGSQFFTEGIPNGKYESYTKEGVMVKTFYFKNGLLDGPYSYYYPDGTLMRKGHFKNDHDIGLSYHYHKNGKLSLEESYNAKGIQEGTVKFYNKDGELVREEKQYK